MKYDLSNPITRRAVEQAAERKEAWALEAMVEASRTTLSPNGSSIHQSHAKPGTSKFGNKRVVNERGEFDSILESDAHLKLVSAYGNNGVIRQVSMPIEGGRIRPDFLVIHERLPDGRFVGEFIDAKGRQTGPWKKSAKQLMERHGIGIRLMTRKDV